MLVRVWKRRVRVVETESVRERGVSKWDGRGEGKGKGKGVTLDLGEVGGYGCHLGQMGSGVVEGKIGGLKDGRRVERVVGVDVD